MGYIGNGPYQGVLTGGNIQDGTIDTTDLADASVETVKINDLNVTAGKLANSLNLVGKTITNVNIDSGNLDGVVIGGTTAGAVTGTTITGTSFVSSGNMTFGDNDKAIFGAGSDLQIYHSDTKSYIRDAGTGDLVIGTDGAKIEIYDYANTNTLANLVTGGAVELFHNGDKKLATTSTGIDVTGTVTADGLTVDTNTLHVDSTNNRVGIGTTNPIFELGFPIGNNQKIGQYRDTPHQAGNVGSIGLVINDGGGSSGVFVHNTHNGTYSSQDIRLLTAEGGVTTASERLRIASNGDISFYEDTGNTPKLVWKAGDERLGIGTSSPSALLHLDGTTPSIYLQPSADTEVAAIRFRNAADNNTQGMVEYNHSENSMSFRTNGVSDRLFLDSSGNVGIGTSSPATALDVTGTVTADGLTVDGNVSFGDNDKAIFGAGSDLQIYHDGANSYITDAGTGKLYIAGDTETAIVNAAVTEFKAKFTTDGAVELYNNNSLKLATTSTGIDVTGTVTADGLTVDGDATIGQASEADRKLSIGSSGATHFDIDTEGATGRVYLNVTNDSTAGKMYFKTADTDRLFISNNGDISFYEATGNTPKLVWKAGDERLGIGTSSPNHKVDIVGSSENLLELTSSGSFGTALNITQNTPSTSILVNSTSTGDIVDLRDNGTTVFTVKDGGNVGIGTSSPNGKAEISSSATGDVLALQLSNSAGAGSDSVSLNFRNSTSSTSNSGGSQLTALRDSSGNGGSLIAKTASSVGTMTERMRIDSSGKVGIGTSSPDQLLHISGGSGTARMMFTRSNTADTGNSFGELNFENSVGTTLASIKAISMSGNTESGFVFGCGSSNTERMRIDSSGNVGIGTSSPSSYYSAGNDLVVGGTSSHGISVLSGTTSQGILAFADGTTGGAQQYAGYMIYDHTSDSLRLATTATERMRIDSSGNVGIGGSYVPYKLNISDTSDVSVGMINSDPLTSGNRASLAALNSANSTVGYIRFGAVTDNVGTNIQFATRPAGGSISEAMRIDSSGNVGIGTSSPSQQLELLSASPAVKLRSSGTNGGILIFNVNGTDKGYIGSSYHLLSGGSSNDTTIRANGELQIATGGATERMRIDSSGDVRIGNILSSSWETNTNGLLLSTTGTSALAVNRDISDGPCVRFGRASVVVGSISVTSSSTAYNTSSDYRLKTDVQPMTGATERLKALKPVNFEWISSGERVDGFLAHEAQEVVPEAVTGTKDAMRTEEYEVTPAVEATYNDEGNELTAAVEAVMGTREVPDYQGIDQSKLVPLLTAALQEAVAKIESLEARIAALESN